MSMQDVIAIAVALVAAAWLGRTLVRRLFAPSCGPPAQPGGGDGFVPLETLSKRPRASPQDEAEPATRPIR
jgi:hypothetical protein